MGKTEKVPASRAAVRSTRLLGERIREILGPYLEHHGSCHREIWGGYCNCGLTAAKRKVRQLLAPNNDYTNTPPPK